MLLLFKILLLAALLIWTLAIIPAYQYGQLGRNLLKIDKRLNAVEEDLPPLTVIIAAHNQAPALRRHLPVILNQDYTRFEVIVIDMASTDETKDVLERLELQYAYLRHTHTPSSARDISVERLALTLGFRAASHEWVVITRPDCEPISPHWLTRIGETIIHPKQGIQSPRLKQPDMVLGMARFDEQRSTWLDYKMGFYRLWNTLEGSRHVLNGHAAVRADYCNIAFRKNYFFEQGGFADAQGLKAGAAELLVNHTSTPYNTAALLLPSAMVVQDMVNSDSLWAKRRVFYAETRRHQRHAFLYRFVQAWHQLMPWLVLFGIVMPLIGSIIFLFVEQEAEVHRNLIVLTVVLALLLVTYTITKISSLRITTRALGCRSYYLSLIPLELQLPVQNLMSRITRRFSSNNEFRKKFV
ncbi:MAG: glycosyltransferase [Prevotella sp.]|nr:glycosyltransferase [Prevotella sp.]